MFVLSNKEIIPKTNKFETGGNKATAFEHRIIKGRVYFFLRQGKNRTQKESRSWQHRSAPGLLTSKSLQLSL